MSLLHRHDISYITPVPVETEIVNESAILSDVPYRLDTLARILAESVGLFDDILGSPQFRIGLSEVLGVSDIPDTLDIRAVPVAEGLLLGDVIPFDQVTFARIREAVGVSGTSYFSSADLQFHSEGIEFSETDRISGLIITVPLNESVMLQEALYRGEIIERILDESVIIQDSPRFLSTLFVEMSEVAGILEISQPYIGDLAKSVSEGIGVSETYPWDIPVLNIIVSETTDVTDGILPYIPFLFADAVSRVYLNRTVSDLFSEGAS